MPTRTAAGARSRRPLWTSEMAKVTPVSLTPAEFVAIRRTRKLNQSEKNALLGHVLASLEESARLNKPWREAWEVATADGVEPYVRYLKPSAHRLYALRVGASR